MSRIMCATQFPHRDISSRVSSAQHVHNRALGFQVFEHVVYGICMFHAHTSCHGWPAKCYLLYFLCLNLMNDSIILCLNLVSELPRLGKPSLCSTSLHPQLDLQIMQYETFGKRMESPQLKLCFFISALGWETQKQGNASCYNAYDLITVKIKYSRELKGQSKVDESK